MYNKTPRRLIHLSDRLWPDHRGKCEDLFKIYPLMLYPCKLVDRGGMVRLPASAATSAGATPPSAMALNLGVYGIPETLAINYAAAEAKGGPDPLTAVRFQLYF